MRKNDGLRDGGELVFGVRSCVDDLYLGSQWMMSISKQWSVSKRFIKGLVCRRLSMKTLFSYRFPGHYKYGG
jgi:hypothetical protein